ncbi:hypothetical protein [uncultured Sphingomonas sp.]|uniref:hypothetical protein n=1 Tax=uncultured Sphingomonas sp. TaxID=158754 RepID=UPI0035C97974
MRTSRRVGFLAPLALTAACSKEGAAERDAEALVDRPIVIAEINHVTCAHPGEDLAPLCTIDRERTDQRLALTVRHPDGAFRRLRVTADGRGVVAADGAEPARVAVLDAENIEVAVGGDRYRLPATVQGSTARP